MHAEGDRTPPRIPLTHDEPIACFNGLGPTRAVDLAPPDADDAPEFWSVTLVLKGNAASEPDTRPVPLVKGSALIVLPESDECPMAAPGVEAVTIVVHADWALELLRSLWSEPGLVRILIAERLFPVCRHCIGTMIFEPTEKEFAILRAESELLRNSNDGTSAPLPMRAGALLKMLAILNQCLEREDTGANLPLQPAVWRVADAIEAAVGHGQAVNLAELAAMVDLPQARFARMFRDATGVAPRDYIQVRRIQLGSRMLIEDMDTVTEIALRLGYADAAHFCRVFKRIRGVSPNEFRRRYAVPSAGDEGALGVDDD